MIVLPLHFGVGRFPELQRPAALHALAAWLHSTSVLLASLQSPALKSPYVKIASEQGPPQEMYMPTLGQPATPGWHADPHATIGIGVRCPTACVTVHWEGKKMLC